MSRSKVFQDSTDIHHHCMEHKQPVKLIESKDSGEKEKEEEAEEEDNTQSQVYYDSVEYQTNVDCLLSIRLLNGRRLLHCFNMEDRLKDVRTWVDLNRTDGSAEFVFYDTRRRKNIEICEEDEMLCGLKFQSRSLLILGKLQNEKSRSSLSAANSNKYLWLNKLCDTFFWALGYEENNYGSGTISSNNYKNNTASRNNQNIHYLSSISNSRK